MNIRLIMMGILLAFGEMNSMSRMQKLKHVSGGCAAVLGIAVIGALIINYWKKRHIDPQAYKKAMELITLQQEIIEEMRQMKSYYLVLENEQKKLDQRQVNWRFNMMAADLLNNKQEFVINENGIPVVLANFLLENKAMLGDELYAHYLKRCYKVVELFKDMKNNN